MPALLHSFPILPSPAKADRPALLTPTGVTQLCHRQGHSRRRPLMLAHLRAQKRVWTMKAATSRAPTFTSRHLTRPSPMRGARGHSRRRPAALSKRSSPNLNILPSSAALKQASRLRSARTTALWQLPSTRSCRNRRPTIQPVAYQLAGNNIGRARICAGWRDCFPPNGQRAPKLPRSRSRRSGVFSFWSPGLRLAHGVGLGALYPRANAPLCRATT